MLPILIFFILWAHSALAQDEIPSPDRAKVKKLVEETIALGVPLFNSGRFEACVSAYGIALRSLQLLAPDSIPAQAVKEALERAAGEDVERGAWTLRYALDEVYRNVY